MEIETAEIEECLYISSTICLIPKLKNCKIVQKSSEWLKSTRSHLDVAFSFKAHKIGKMAEKLVPKTL